MTRSLEDMILEVRNGIDPVAMRLGLRGPAVERKNMYFRLAYFGKEIGLEIVTDFDPFFVLALPFRHKSHVNLILAGPPGTYADPDGRLEGEGKTGRHLTLRSIDELPREAVRAWLRTASQVARAKG